MGRRSFKSEWLKNSQGEICALNLGADYCAEHEHGIEQLLQDLGINNENYQGIESRTIKNLNLDKLQFTTGKTISSLSFNNSVKSNPRTRNPEAIVCEWGSKDFTITVATPENKINLKILHKAFLDKDLAVWVGGGGVFENGGLMLAIPSKVNESDKQTMKESDLDQSKLTKASLATGIHEILKSAGKTYIALSPAWKKDQESQYEVIFWLNPWKSKENQYGWFTVEDLILWSQDKGIIVKNKNIA